MSDAPPIPPIPEELVALQRAVYAAQDALGEPGIDDSERARRRDAEHEAVLALYRHPAKAGVHWRALMDAARAQDHQAD